MKIFKTIVDLLLFSFFFLIKKLKDILIIPSTFHFKKEVNIRQKNTGFFYTAIFLILLIISPSSSLAASFSCNGEDVTDINGATGDEDASYVTNRNNKSARYFKFTTDTDGVITITQKNNKPESGFYNHKLKIGYSCNDASIHDGTGSKLDSAIFNVVSGTTYYVKVQEANTQNDLNFDIDFQFRKQEPTSYGCSKPHAFEERVSYIVPGDLIAIGNSNICADNDRDGTCDPDQKKRNDIGDGGNNIIFINSSSSSSVSNEPSSLFNTTAAELKLPEGAVIKWAGLYWQGEIWDIKTSNTSRTSANKYNGNDIAIENGQDGQDRKDKANTIKFKMPGGSYQELTADEHYYVFVKRRTTNSKDDYSGISRYEEHYQSFKDVTSMLQGLSDANGDYWAADMQATVGALHYPGVEAAWNLQVIYENPGENPRSITINDGYIALYGSASQGDDYANENNCPTGGINTGIYAYDVSFDISGFLTPKTPGFYTDMTVFVTESDPDSGYDASLPEELSVTKDDGTKSVVDGPDLGNTDAWQYEITHKDGTNNLNRTPPYIYPIGMTIKNYHKLDLISPEQTSTTATFKTDSDRLILGVIGFATDLRRPNLCYDYAYKQNDQYFTEDNNGSYEPRIVGDGLSTSEPITVELYIRNTEDSDILAQNTTVDIYDINTTQAKYINGSTYVITPNSVFPQQHNDTDSGIDHINDILIGDVDSQDYFYVDYDLDPVTSNINMPLNARISYTSIIPYGDAGATLEIDYVNTLNSDIPMCSSDNFAYVPTYGTFNVENSVLSQSQKYNLPTQTANRAGDFVVTAYDDNAIHTRKGLSTVVAVELIDAGKFHGIDASCHEPDSALTPRVWVTFGNTTDGNVSVTDFDYATLTYAMTYDMISDRISGGGTPLASAEEFYGQARANTAFRISYQRAGTGDEVVQLEPNSCKGTQVGPCYKVLNFPDLSQVDLGAGKGNCIQDIDGKNGLDKIPENCGNSGAKGLDSPGLATCMECIYGYNISYVCSRDNFATRPESFRMNLKDQEQNVTTAPLQSSITVNNNPSLNHTSDTALHVAAGYNYALEINATNHQNDNNTPGYHAEFALDGNGSKRSLRLAWQASTDDTKCNDIEDHNVSTLFKNGAADLNLSSPQIGNYNLTIMDKLWTKVDHDSVLMSHHTTGDGLGYFISGSDCVTDNSIVPIQNASTSTYEEDKSGCDITTYNTLTNLHHTNPDTDPDTEYTDIPLRIHPYKFDQAGILPAIGPYTRTSGQTFVYINTPDANDGNMSYNMNGTFAAVGYDNGRLSNFVEGCYADDVNMTLYLQYVSGQPATTDFEPYFSYDFVNTDPTNQNSIITGSERPTVASAEPSYRYSTLGPLSFTQEDDWFIKDLNGSITMDLGYNFKRNNDEVMNPRYIQMNDFNITYDNNPSGIRADLKPATGDDFKIFGNKTLDQNVSFFYGRAKSGKFFYEGILTATVNTPILAVAYCDLGFAECQDRGILSLLAQTNEPNWWLSVDHKTAEGDGDIALSIGTITEGAGSAPSVAPTVIDIINEAQDKNVVVSRGANAVLPLTVPINLVTDPTQANFTGKWLIYNKDDPNLDPDPFYKVRFVGESGWTGIGETGHVIETNASSSKTKRLSW